MGIVESTSCCGARGPPPGKGNTMAPLNASGIVGNKGGSFRAALSPRNQSIKALSPRKPAVTPGENGSGVKTTETSTVSVTVTGTASSSATDTTSELAQAQQRIAQQKAMWQQKQYGGAASNAPTTTGPVAVASAPVVKVTYAATSTSTTATSSGHGSTLQPITEVAQAQRTVEQSKNMWAERQRRASLSDGPPPPAIVVTPPSPAMAAIKQPDSVSSQPAASASAGNFVNDRKNMWEAVTKPDLGSGGGGSAGASQERRGSSAGAITELQAQLLAQTNASITAAAQGPKPDMEVLTTNKAVAQQKDAVGGKIENILQRGAGQSIGYNTMPAQRSRPSTFSAEPKSLAPSSSDIVPGTKCKVCGLSAFQNESVVYDKLVWHQRCFRCENCNTALSLGAVSKMENRIFCKSCFVRIFKSTGGRYDAFTSNETLETRPATSAAAGEVEQQSASQSLADRRKSYMTAVDSLPKEETDEDLQERLRQAKEDRLRQEAVNGAGERRLSIQHHAVAEALQAAVQQQQDIEKALNLDDMLAEHTGSELNLNNTQMFMKSTKEQRTQKYNQIFSFLQTHPNVTVFTCSAGDLDDEFAIGFADVLRTNTSLLEVNVENNRISDKGIVAIAESMAENSTLKTIKLLHNTVANAAADAVSGMVDMKNPRRNRTLQKVTFHCNMAQYKDRLARGLEENFKIMKGWKQTL